MPTVFYELFHVAVGSWSDLSACAHCERMVTADADMRHKMNVEDEYFLANKKRDTEILM